MLRADDVVNNFSSRGPTRAVSFDDNGQRRFDHLIKPDLVAPGNQLLGAMATNERGNQWNEIAKHHRNTRP